MAIYQIAEDEAGSFFLVKVGGTKYTVINPSRRLVYASGCGVLGDIVDLATCSKAVVCACNYTGPPPSLE